MNLKPTSFEAPNMTTKEMLKSKLPEGFVWENYAPFGAKPKWRAIPAPADWHFFSKR